MDGVRVSQLSMIAIRKGAVVIALEEWLGRADGSGGMSAEQYVAAYGARARPRRLADLRGEKDSAP
jgi:hypothetical protein